MPTAQIYSDYAVADTVLEDGSVTIRCSTDVNKWPWLALPPSHPIVLQLINYFTSVEAAIARGSWDKDKWSALTRHQWWCGATGPEATHATHGIAEPGEDESPNFAITLFDDAGRLVYRNRGTGVVFHNRDFESWRTKAKAKIAALPEPRNFRFASKEALGAQTDAECLVSPLHEESDRAWCEAYLTQQNGFDDHPYHDGSGDHVNSTQQADVIRQTAVLARGVTANNTIAAGDMIFTRYVELGRPFRIEIDKTKTVGDVMVFTVSQADKPCVEATLRFVS